MGSTRCPSGASSAAGGVAGGAVTAVCRAGRVPDLPGDHFIRYQKCTRN